MSCSVGLRSFGRLLSFRQAEDVGYYISCTSIAASGLDFERNLYMRLTITLGVVLRVFAKTLRTAVSE
jgi:hypothetical protein